MSVSCLCDDLAIYKLRLTLSGRVYCLSDLRDPAPFFSVPSSGEAALSGGALARETVQMAVLTLALSVCISYT